RAKAARRARLPPGRWRRSQRRRHCTGQSPAGRSQARGTGEPPGPLTSPSAHQMRGPPNWPRPRRPAAPAPHPRRPAARAAPANHVARRMHRRRPCRCGGFDACTDGLRTANARMYTFPIPMPQFIYTMKGLGKVHAPDNRVLDDIWLSFYFGAKIGVLGLNGAGKSSLLRIMAAEDQSFLGEAFSAEGISVGFLPQEPQLDPSKSALGNVEEGVAPIKALLTRYDEVNDKLGQDLSPDEMEKVLDEQSRIQDKIDASNAWDIDSRLELAMDALRLPPPDADVTKLSGGERRRVALCRLLLQSPDLLLLDEPTNHLDAESVAWLERFLKDYQGTVVAV